MSKASGGVQLPLGLALRDGFGLDNFHPGANAQALHAVREAQLPFIYLWGAYGSGRSHLLQAAVGAESAPALYLPLAEARDYGPEMLEGLEEMALLALDDIEQVAGERPWEEALFHLYNRLHLAGGRLLVAADRAPVNLPLLIPDLRTRLSHGVTLQLQTLDDDGLAAALQLRAAQRGLELGDEVASYLLRRAPRDSHALFELLERLDQASWEQKRRLTVPFVRGLLDTPEH